MLLKTSIIEFHKKYYIPAIQNWYFIYIPWTHHYGKECHKEFKRRGNLHDVLFHRDYAEWVVSSFAHQIQSKYYGGNRSVYIEIITLENFNVSHHSIPLLASDHVSRKAVIQYFFLTTENRILQTRMNKVNELLNCWKTEQYCLLTHVLYVIILMDVWSNIPVWQHYICYQCWHTYIIS